MSSKNFSAQLATGDRTTAEKTGNVNFGGDKHIGSCFFCFDTFAVDKIRNRNRIHEQ